MPHPDNPHFDEPHNFGNDRPNFGQRTFDQQPGFRPQGANMANGQILATITSALQAAGQSMPQITNVIQALGAGAAWSTQAKAYLAQIAAVINNPAEVARIAQLALEIPNLPASAAPPFQILVSEGQSVPAGTALNEQQQSSILTNVQLAEAAVSNATTHTFW